MMKLITPIPGTHKRVETVEYEDGTFCVSLQQNAENLINPYPWEIHADGWRDCMSKFVSDVIEAYDLHDQFIGREVYDLHDQFIGREVRMEYECKQ